MAPKLHAAAVGLLLLLSTASAIHVSVMLSLTTMRPDGTLNNPDKVKNDLARLKSAGVDGVMVDVWWGIVEPQPKQYVWTGYLQLAQIVQSFNMTLQLVASFHQCGGNVGDTCNTPLPSWVRSVGNSNPDIFYKDSNGSPDVEYLSLGVDNVPLFGGRTPLQIYADFFESMRSNFRGYMPSVIDEVQVGLGPAGELRYPGYQSDKWSYCGIGAFQCYDKYMLADLAASAAAAGHSEWGHGGPNDAGSYNSKPPQSVGFFSDNTNDNYNSPYGDFFLGWYSQKLIDHGASILTLARNFFPVNSGVNIAAKVSGIHWWYDTDSHAAECTAGYYNTDQNNAYLSLAKMFSNNSVTFDFTCLEMTADQSCNSDPQALVRQTRLASAAVNIPFSGENALEICTPQCDGNKFNQIVNVASQRIGQFTQFTYLRLTDNLISDNYGNFNTFRNFVSRMHSV